jgi:multidrug efflux pump subunit AcrA (membrane-fusion protein)
MAAKPMARYRLPVMNSVKPATPARVIAWLLLIGIALAAVVLWFTPWVQNVTGTGRVIAVNPNDREQRISAPVEGRVVKWHVMEGTRVKKGDLLVEFSDNDPLILERLQNQRDAINMRLDQLKNRVSNLTQGVQGLEGSRRNALDAGLARLQMAKENVRAAQRSLDAAEANENTTRLNIDRQRQLLAKGLTSKRSLELAELDHNRAIADVDRAKAQLTAAESDRLAREADQQKIETDFRTSIENAQGTAASGQGDIANAMAELHRLDVQIARQSQQQIYAPRDGTVFRLLAQPFSELLKAGEALAILIPETNDPTVELLMDGNDAPLIQAGAKVRVQFEGWPAIQFAGWPSVAVGTFGGEVMLVDSTDNGQGKFRILVKPDTNDEPWPGRVYLRQGVRANGWVLLRTVPLWFELWRQFNGFPPTVASSEPGKNGDKKK